MNKYVFSFTNNQVNGQQLLHIRSYELEQLGMTSIGHQEIVLEAVESLRNFVCNLILQRKKTKYYIFIALQHRQRESSVSRHSSNYCC